MKTITKKQWNETPRDYKSIINGQRHVLAMTEHGTSLVPVKVCNHSERVGDYCEHCEFGSDIEKVEKKLKKIAGFG